ncbi:unnamed protein product [Tuber melanosporum]|uniref:(Perigord truffle) hypothetical protein n=1 Tax=Tuber melanosporum (strain Mel28) TaxID=656061 RepID=D5GPF1_TUBMM|nr:uncharacterized protein GSTUM_00011805001 [Tuber melanosporum]CAZ86394.1 unnamed protein product [Tuber melanosporum]
MLAPPFSTRVVSTKNKVNSLRRSNLTTVLLLRYHTRYLSYPHRYEEKREAGHKNGSRRTTSRDRGFAIHLPR